MVKQIIIAAGGIGSRMSNSLNPRGCKSLIEYKGIPLIYYLLINAKEAGIKEFFISINEYNINIMKKIVDDIKISHIILPPSPNGFEGAPNLFKKYLDDRVLIACGHHFIPTKHFNSLIEYSKDFTAVYSAYLDPPQTISDQPRRTLIHNLEDPNRLRFEKVDLNTDKVSSPFYYTRNPYIVTKEMIDNVEKNGFKKTVGFFIYKHWEEGGKVIAVKSIMPPEFDYDHEFIRTKDYMDKYFLNPNN